MKPELKFIKNTNWGELLELNSTVCIHKIKHQQLSQAENDELLNFKITLNKKYNLVVQLWEDVLTRSPNLVAKRLSALNGSIQKIHARKCQIKEINQQEMSRFLNENHLQFTAKSKVRYGLFFEEELLSVALFSMPRAMTYNEKKDYFSGELIRFCSKAGTRIYGGLDKFLKHYERIFKVNDVMTYADKDWSNGASFFKLGFKQVKEKQAMAFVLNESEKRILIPQPLGNEKYLWNSGSIKFVRYAEQ